MVINSLKKSEGVARRMSVGFHCRVAMFEILKVFFFFFKLKNYKDELDEIYINVSQGVKQTIGLFLLCENIFGFLPFLLQFLSSNAKS